VAQLEYKIDTSKPMGATVTGSLSQQLNREGNTLVVDGARRESLDEVWEKITQTLSD